MNDTQGSSVPKALETGAVFLFSDWPIEDLPSGPGIYTVWNGDAFLYVGVAGRAHFQRPKAPRGTPIRRSS